MWFAMFSILMFSKGNNRKVFKKNKLRRTLKFYLEWEYTDAQLVNIIKETFLAAHMEINVLLGNNSF